MLGIVSLSRTGGLNVLGRNTTPNLVRRYLRILKHQGSCSYNRPFTHLATVEQRSSHTNQCVIMNSASMNGNIVSDGNVAADVRRTCLMGNVDTGTVLYIGAVANGDGGYIAPYYGIEPDGTLVAHSYFANNGGILTEIAVFAPLGRETAI